MMQVCSLFCILLLWWSTASLGATVDAPNPNLSHVALEEISTGLKKVSKVATTADRKKAGSESQKAFVVHTLNYPQKIDTVIEETAHHKTVDRLTRRQRRSYVEASPRYLRLPESTWKRRPWRADSRPTHDDDYSSDIKSSYTDIYGDINTNHLEEAAAPKVRPLEAETKETITSDDRRPAEEGLSASSASETFPEMGQKPLKRSDRSLSSLSSDLLTSAGQTIARNFMKRRRGGRMYDVPQIECPRSNDRMERFACPSPDFRGRYRCIDDRSLCDGFFDCPGREDENPDQCLFYKTTKAHLDILAEALLRWARGR